MWNERFTLRLLLKLFLFMIDISYHSFNFDASRYLCCNVLQRNVTYDILFSCGCDEMAIMTLFQSVLQGSSPCTRTMQTEVVCSGTIGKPRRNITQPLNAPSRCRQDSKASDCKPEMHECKSHLRVHVIWLQLYVRGKSAHLVIKLTIIAGNACRSQE